MMDESLVLGKIIQELFSPKHRKGTLRSL